MQSCHAPAAGPTWTGLRRAGWCMAWHLLCRDCPVPAEAARFFYFIILLPPLHCRLQGRGRPSPRSEGLPGNVCWCTGEGTALTANGSCSAHLVRSPMPACRCLLPCSEDVLGTIAASSLANTRVSMSEKNSLRAQAGGAGVPGQLQKCSNARVQPSSFVCC